MHMRGQLQLSFLFTFLFFYSSSFALQINAVNSGPWNSTLTWQGGVIPGGSDDVTIDGFEVYVDGINVSANSITLENTSGVFTELKVYGISPALLTVKNDIIVNHTDTGADTKLSVYGLGKIDVGGATVMTRLSSMTDDHVMQLSITGSGVYETDAILVDYHNSGLGENAYEIVVDNNGKLNVDGSAQFYTRGGEGFQMKANSLSDVTIGGDLEGELFGGKELYFEATNSADLFVTGAVNLKNGTVSGLIKFTSFDANLAFDSTLMITALTPSGSIGIEISGPTGLLSIEDDLVFDVYFENTGSIGLTNSAKLAVEGSILRLNDLGAIQMDNTSSIEFLGSNPFQMIPAEKLTNSTDSIKMTNVIINKPIGTEIVLNGDATLYNNLHLTSGIVKTSNGNDLTLADGVKITGASEDSYIAGAIIKKGTFPDPTFVFPVGHNGRYAPIEMTKSTDPEGTYRAEYFSCPPPFGGDTEDGLHSYSTKEFWNFESNNTLNEQVNVSLYWTDPVYSGIQNLDSLVVVYFNVVDDEWQSLGQEATSGSNSGPGSVTNAFSCPPPFGSVDMTFGSKDASNALPVDLNYFKGSLKGNKVFLQWETESEVNFDRFEIERSSDAKSFHRIVEVPSLNQSTRNIYQVCDEKPLYGANYYRLKMIDEDGMYSYTRKIVFNFEKAEEWTVFPNPVVNEFGILGAEEENSDSKIQVFNQSGRLMYSGDLGNMANGELLSTSTFNADVPGLYYMYIESNGIKRVLSFYKGE